MANPSLEMVAILVMHTPMLLESLGLDDEHVTWAMGLLLIPMGQPGGGLEGETCEGALAL